MSLSAFNRARAVQKAKELADKKPTPVVTEKVVEKSAEVKVEEKTEKVETEPKVEKPKKTDAEKLAKK